MQHFCEFCNEHAAWKSPTAFKAEQYMCERHYQKYGSQIRAEKVKPPYETKICSACATEKSVTEFYVNNTSGKVYYSARCKVCDRKYQKERYKCRQK